MKMQRDNGVVAESYFANRRAEMLDFIPNTARTILDAGCGNGAFSATIKAQRDATVWGIELNATAAQTAREVLDHVLSGPIEEHLDGLPDAYFDCICMNDILEHLLDPWQTLNKLRTKLAPDGVIVASIPNIRHYKVLWSLLVTGEWTYTDSGVLDRTHLRFFTPKSMQRLFIDCGYSVATMQGIRGSKKFKVKVWRFLSAGKLWDIRYPQFAIVAKSIDSSSPATKT